MTIIHHERNRRLRVVLLCGMANSMTSAVIVLLLLSGCAAQRAPVPPEGRVIHHDNLGGRVVNFLAFLQVREPAEFDVVQLPATPDQVAAAVVAAATQPRYHWQARISVRGDDRWVHLRDGHGWHDVRIAPVPQGAELQVGRGNLYLPPHLLPAVQGQLTVEN